MSQKGFIHLLPLLLVAAIAVGAFFVLTGKFKTPSLFKKKPKVELQTQYKNPFNQETQFVNPFDQYKNPFVTGR